MHGSEERWPDSTSGHLSGCHSVASPLVLWLQGLHARHPHSRSLLGLSLPSGEESERGKQQNRERERVWEGEEEGGEEGRREEGGPGEVGG